MSTYEKIASIIIAVFVILGVVFSVREIREPEHELQSMPNMPSHGSDFDGSIGADFKIGPFSHLSSIRATGATDPNCAAITPVILGVLHDVDERLESHSNAPASQLSGAFEASAPVLQAFCSASTTVTLLDDSGDVLSLSKVPFERIVPPGGMQADIGTDVRINATVVRLGQATSSAPTAYGELLVPDRFLDMTAPGARADRP